MSGARDRYPGAMSTEPRTQRPAWLVVVRFGGIVAVLGIVIALIGWGGAYALAQVGVWILVLGGVVAALGMVYRLAKGRTD